MFEVFWRSEFLTKEQRVKFLQQLVGTNIVFWFTILLANIHHRGWVILTAILVAVQFAQLGAISVEITKAKYAYFTKAILNSGRPPKMSVDELIALAETVGYTYEIKGTNGVRKIVVHGTPPNSNLVDNWSVEL